MSRFYDDARFGAGHIVAPGGASGALNGTVGATILGVFPNGSSATSLSHVGIFFSAGGTGALRQLLIGTATMFAAGTLGAVGYVGTITLGTQANNTSKIAYLGTGVSNTPGNTRPIVQPLDSIVIAQQGTDAITYNIVPMVWGVETFINL